MKSINNIREEINKIDQKISKLLKKRLEKVHEIKEIKKSKKMPITDTEREKIILKNLDSKYEKEIFKKIIELSRKEQH